MFPQVVLAVLYQFRHCKKLKSHQLCRKGRSSARARVVQRLQWHGLTNEVYLGLEVRRLHMCARLPLQMGCVWCFHSQCFVRGLLAKRAVTVCVCVKVRVMQKADLHSASLKPGSKSSSELEDWARAVRRNRWCLFLNLQCFLPCPHPLRTDEMIYLINSRNFCKQNV